MMRLTSHRIMEWPISWPTGILLAFGLTITLLGWALRQLWNEIVLKSSNHNYNTNDKLTAGQALVRIDSKIDTMQESLDEVADQQEELKEAVEQNRDALIEVISVVDDETQADIDIDLDPH